ncbi:MAG: right-handed parallel beta-helix repeat-containing protein [Duncaniella sp.]|nr:right-handed parallel beta-helix repeat-containing protein [Duncaniella sp.]
MKKILKPVLLSAAALVAGMQMSAKDYVITDYGVANDSTVLQTSKIQAVIDRAESDGGGRVVVPAGTFLTGGLFFKPGTTLHLEEGSCIKGSDDIANYPLIPSRMEGRSIYYYAALINAYFVDGFEITGSGIINGNAAKFWDEFWALRAERAKIGKSCTNLEVRRPRLVFLWGCDRVKLSGVKLRNSAFWTTHLYQCNDILIENCHIYAPTKPVKAPSSDALDLDVCRNVTVRGCYLDCNDDGVCIKGGKGVYAHKSIENGSVENVLVEDCVFGPNLHGILTMGSECLHAKNITLRNCRLETTCALLRMKMRPDTYQIYENITISNVTGKCGSVIDMKPWKQFFDLEGSNEKPKGIVRNILIENVDVKCRFLGTIAGNADDEVSNIVLKNIKVEADRDEFTCVYPDVKLENVTVNGKPVTNPAK